MNKNSDWQIIECPVCKQIFAVPCRMTDSIEDRGEGHKFLSCVYCCCDRMEVEKAFVSNQTMDCEVNKTVKWEIK